MRYVVRISPTAKRELMTIADWYRLRAGASEVGDEWYSGFIAALEGLRANPRICSIARESDRAAVRLRELHYGSGKRTTLRAIFEIHGEEVRIHAIRHVAQRDVSPDELTTDW
jgi:plasmid stabilization system protein ParE